MALIHESFSLYIKMIYFIYFMFLVLVSNCRPFLKRAHYSIFCNALSIQNSRLPPFIWNCQVSVAHVILIWLRSQQDNLIKTQRTTAFKDYSADFYYIFYYFCILCSIIIGDIYVRHWKSNNYWLKGCQALFKSL